MLAKPVRIVPQLHENPAIVWRMAETFSRPSSSDLHQSQEAWLENMEELPDWTIGEDKDDFGYGLALISIYSIVQGVVFTQIVKWYIGQNWPRWLCVRHQRWLLQFIAGRCYYQLSVFLSVSLSPSFAFDPLRRNSRGWKVVSPNILA